MSCVQMHMCLLSSRASTLREGDSPGDPSVCSSFYIFKIIIKTYTQNLDSHKDFTSPQDSFMNLQESITYS